MSNVINVTDETFEKEVIEKSNDILVVVDFWAEWCGPCRMLGPILESLAEEYDGKFVLAKADTEKNPIAAANYRVQSIPAVYGIRNGRVQNGFLGALPEPQLREWIDELLPTAVDVLTAEAKELFDSNPQDAEIKLREAIATDARHAPSQIALAELLWQQERIDECKAVIEELSNRGFLEPEAEKIKAALELRDNIGEGQGSSKIQDELQSDPDNQELRLSLAEVLATEEDFEQALENALLVVQNSSGDLRDKARQTMVNIFRVLPADSELTRDYRRRLSLELY